MTKTKKISVFGGATPKPGSPAYQQAYEIGKLLGGTGLTVLTGGYMGTMEAVSRGASEAGGHVIGVTSDEIENFRPVGPNQWVKEEWRCKTLRERLNSLIDNCDAAIALPGGIGTLLEISLTWNQLVINAIEIKPLILIGSEWQMTLETLFNKLGDYIPMKSREYVAFAPDPDAAIEILHQFSGIL